MKKTLLLLALIPFMASCNNETKIEVTDWTELQLNQTLRIFQDGKEMKLYREQAGITYCVETVDHLLSAIMVREQNKYQWTFRGNVCYYIYETL